MKRIYFLLILTISFITIAGSPNVQAQEFVVVINTENNTSDLKQVVAKLYYLRKIKKVWPGSGAVITPVGLKGVSTAKSSFLKNVLKMSETELTAYFRQRHFANAESIPPSFDTEEELVDYVSKNKGAIGYLSAESYARFSSKVKALKIN